MIDIMHETDDSKPDPDDQAAGRRFDYSFFVLPFDEAKTFINSLQNFTFQAINILPITTDQHGAFIAGAKNLDRVLCRIAENIEDHRMTLDIEHQAIDGEAMEYSMDQISLADLDINFPNIAGVDHVVERSKPNPRDPLIVDAENKINKLNIHNGKLKEAARLLLVHCQPSSKKAKAAFDKAHKIVQQVRAEF